jgi:hypothetical protein
MKTIKNPLPIATLNALTVKKVKARTRPGAGSPKPTRAKVTPAKANHKRESTVAVAVTVTLEVAPLDGVNHAVSQVKNLDLREFLQSLVQEPEVALALCTPIPQLSISTACVPRYPMKALSRAAEMAGYWCALGAMERDVLYVATLIRGVQTLLVNTVAGSADLEDILFTLARRALHRLDDRAPRQATLLRLALGWGNADEVDAYYVPRLQEAVARALRTVQSGKGSKPQSWLN